MDDPVFDGAGNRVFQPDRCGHRLLHSRDIFGVDDGEQLEGSRALFSRAEDGPVPGVGLDKTARRIKIPRAKFGRIKGQPPTLLACMKQLFAKPSLGHVAEINRQTFGCRVGSDLVPAVEIRVIRREKFADLQHSNPAIHPLKLTANSARKFLPQHFADQVARAAV